MDEPRLDYPFGTFAPVFAPNPGDVPRYLKLLNLGPGAADVLRLLEQVIADSGEAFDLTVVSLLEQANWRPQLVGSAAMMIGRPSAASVAALWSALDRPCWTSPQLAAAASRVDPAFPEQARLRLERRCLLDTKAASKMSPIERHVSLGPASGYGHSAKLIAALTALLRQAAGGLPWLDELLAEPDVAQLLGEDVDDSGGIATSWLASFDKLRHTAP